MNQYVKLSDNELLKKYLKSGKHDAELRMALADRTQGLVPMQNGQVNVAVALQFMSHVGQLKAAGRRYSGTEYRGYPLVSTDRALLGEVRLLHEPFSFQPLESDGVEPETEMQFPTDRKLMSQLAYIAEYLPGLNPAFTPTNLDEVEKIIGMVTDPITHKPSANIRKLLKDYKRDEDAGDPDKRIFTANLRLEGKQVGGVTVAVTEVGSGPRPFVPGAGSSSFSAPLSPVATGGDHHVVCLFDDADKDCAMGTRQALRSLINQGLISYWDLSDIQPGANRQIEIDRNIGQASVILYVMSADMYGNHVQMIQRLRSEHPTKRHLPIWARAIDLTTTPLSGAVPLPRDKPIRSFSDKDEAYLQISQGVRQVIQGLNKK